ncbi:hypothetical protein GQ600_17249 [Phytophthora cactorum]|nr:hypothetical protein GQ600_17249 [Phytophthora cactorum]
MGVTPITVIPPSVGKYYRRLITDGLGQAARRANERNTFEVNQMRGAVCDSNLVTQQVTAHNHPDQLTYANHPSNCRVEDVDVLDFVEELQAAESKSLYATYKTKEARRGSITVESRLDCCFREFCSHEGNTATVYVDAKNVADNQISDAPNALVL